MSASEGRTNVRIRGGGRMSASADGGRRMGCSPPLFRLAAIGFQTIAVRIDDESGVVVVAVILAQAGLAVVLAAGLQRARMEGIDRLARSRVEAEVQICLLIDGYGL